MLDNDRKPVIMVVDNQPEVAEVGVIICQTLGMRHSNREPIILVVDDEDDLARLGAQLVEMCGYRGISCTSVKEAKSLLKECDLVFTDLKMDGLTGFDLIEWIRSEGSDIPIVATSGNQHALSEGSEI